MKRLIAFFLMIVLFIQILPMAFAQTSANLNFTSATAMPGEEVVITVSVNNCVAAKSIYIVPQYNEQILEIVSGTWLIGGILSDDYSDTYGDAAIAFSENTDINTNIFVFVFKVKENAPSGTETNVSCEVVIKTMDGKEEIPVAVEVNAGTITIEKAESSVLLGDVNGDGKVNARDSRALLRYIAGLVEAEEINLAAADYNGDGRVNARDSRSILRFIAGLDE